MPVTEASHVVELCPTTQPPRFAKAKDSDALEDRSKLIPVALLPTGTLMAFALLVEGLMVTVNDADLVLSTWLVAVMVTGLLPPGRAAGALYVTLW